MSEILYLIEVRAQLLLIHAIEHNKLTKSMREGLNSLEKSLEEKKSIFQLTEKQYIMEWSRLLINQSNHMIDLIKEYRIKRVNLMACQNIELLKIDRQISLAKTY